MRMPGGTQLRNVSLGYEGEASSDEMLARVHKGLIDVDMK